MGKKVLIVDDSPTVRQQVKLALKHGGFEILEAVDGLDGLDVIAKNPDLAVTLCDVNMPRMNGLEMIEKLAAGGKRPDLPVLMLTTEGKPELMQRAKAAGAKGWIVKPFKADLLIAALRKMTA